MTRRRKLKRARFRAAPLFVLLLSLMPACILFVFAQQQTSAVDFNNNLPLLESIIPRNDIDKHLPEESYVLSADEFEQLPNYPPVADSKALPRPEKPPSDVIFETFSGNDTSEGFYKYGSGYINNLTKLSFAELGSVIKAKKDPPRVTSEKPSVLIISTHTTESYIADGVENSRSLDKTKNMVAVGEVVAKVLEEAGISVIQDKNIYDHPSYNSSYARAEKAITAHLKSNPSISVVLDLHRDAIERDGKRVAAAAAINGKTAAQVMLIAGVETSSFSFPNWRDNLNFTAKLQHTLENRYSNLTRPLLLCYKRYNMHLSKGSVLVEIGTDGNTLGEALYGAELFARGLAEYLNHA